MHGLRNFGLLIAADVAIVAALFGLQAGSDALLGASAQQTLTLLFVAGLGIALVRRVRKVRRQAAYERTLMASVSVDLAHSVGWLGSAWRRFPFVTVAIIVATSVVSLIAFGLPGSSTGRLSPLIGGLMLSPGAIEGGQIYRLASVALVHASVLHLALGMAVLWFIGVSEQGEIRFGRLGWLAIYLGSGITASAASLLVSHQIAVGASGAIMGSLGAMIVVRTLDLRTLAAAHDSGAVGDHHDSLHAAEHDTLRNRRRYANLALAIMIFGTAASLGGLGLIDNVAHAVGLTTGMVLALLLNLGLLRASQRELVTGLVPVSSASNESHRH
jgi:membrane associated rhomboid family serine protease